MPGHDRLAFCKYGMRFLYRFPLPLILFISGLLFELILSHFLISLKISVHHPAEG